jgi:hypothetical protein
MAEQTFFNDAGITVTNARFITTGQTYAMSGVTSVKNLRRDPKRLGPIILAVVGLLMLLGGSSMLLFGLLLVAGGVAWWILDKPKYIVSLTTSSGEAEATWSKNRDFIEKIVAAVNEAIVHRG